jgi:hypothetical protein
MKSSLLGFREYTGEGDSLMWRHDLELSHFIETFSFCSIKCRLISDDLENLDILELELSPLFCPTRSQLIY